MCENSSLFYNTFFAKLKLIITKGWEFLISYLSKKRENCSKLTSLQEAIWCFTWIRISQSKNLTKENYYMSLLYYSNNMTTVVEYHFRLQYARHYNPIFQFGLWSRAVIITYNLCTKQWNVSLKSAVYNQERFQIKSGL